MWDWLRSVLGETTTGEVVLAAVLFVCVLGFSWIPRIGEAIGAFFDDSDVPDGDGAQGLSRQAKRDESEG